MIERETTAIERKTTAIGAIGAIGARSALDRRPTSARSALDRRNRPNRCGGITSRVCGCVYMPATARAHTAIARRRAVRACEMALKSVEPTRARCALAGWLYKLSRNPLPLVMSGVMVRCVCGAAWLWCGEHGGGGESGRPRRGRAARSSRRSSPCPSRSWPALGPL